jgi:sugar lactone lactonase YvrE
MHRTAFVLLSTTLLLVAADPAPRWFDLNTAARAAVQAKDFAKLRETLLQLKPLVPGNPRLVYNLAASEAVLGHRTAAIACIRNLTGMGLIYDLAADPDFESIKTTPGFKAAIDRVTANKKPVSHSTAAFPIAGHDLIAEDIAYDPSTKRFFVSSVRHGQILTPDGKEFAHADWSILAIHADPARRLLWATTAWLAECAACKPGDKDKTALLAFDLDSGALKQRIESPVPGALGDLTTSSTGDVFVSEGLHGAIFRLRAGAQEFERLDTPGEFPSPQTAALSADEQTLYIPDYARGIAAMHLSDRKVEWIQPADDIALNGIDGLYRDGDHFLAVQNGTNPKRLVRLSLDLHKQEILEANTPYLGEPTHGVFANGDFYFIANSGWSSTPPIESTVRKLSR